MQQTQHDNRLCALGAWLTEVLGYEPELSVASADASFRRYFRVKTPDGSRIAMDAPPEKENCRPFVDIAARLRAVGLNAPEVLAQDLKQGFLLLTDLGRNTFLEVMAPDTADDFFRPAIAALARMQSLTRTAGLPEYDRALLQRELDLYPDWYLARHAGVDISPSERGVWEDACERLINSALSQPQVFVHRDFMPRNLMVSEPMPGIIDFQDAVRGPVTYDVVSLFRDAFVSWPETRIANWLAEYRHQAAAAGVKLPDDFERALDWMGLQRHLKVIGIFARLHYRDGKAKYLAETPRFFRYVHDIGAKYPEFEELLELMRRYEVRA